MVCCCLLTGLGWAPRGARAVDIPLPGHVFSLPDGFEIEVVAGPPLVQRPMMADFDEEGRLYVADSAGSNEPVQTQLERKPHRIVRLEDTDGDGRYDRSVVFADQMMFPEGVLWFDGAVYSGAPPTIWKLEDTDGDGVADRRTPWFEGKTLTGCANDLHGPYLGPDGWFYWCKGAFAEQVHARPGRAPIKDSAAHIFRCRPDGTAFDSVISGGMDNPVEVAWSPEGDLFFSTTFYSHPEAGQRDALVHAIYGGVYPKVHGVIDGLKRTGELMPAMTHLGPAAACSLHRYAARALDETYAGNLFSTLFNLRKVMRHVLVPEGATFRTRDYEFLVSDNPDFHPTDVFEDADGSLLVIDTGGWYKLCCPTSQLARPEVLGAIYRIRRTGMPRVDDPRGMRLAWSGVTPREVAARLDDPRPFVRERARRTLAKLGPGAVEVLAPLAREATSVEVRRNALWTLARVGSAEAVDAARAGLTDPEPGVRQVAAHVAGVHRDVQAVVRLAQLVVEDVPHVRRTAASALAQIGGADAVPALLRALEQPVDRTLEHALIYALLESGRAGPLLEVVRAASGAVPTSVLRGALIALDQMDASPLTAEWVIPRLEAADPVVRDTARWIIAHRPAWGPAIAGYLREQLARPHLVEADCADLKAELITFSSDPTVRRIMAQALEGPDTPRTNRVLVLEAMARTRLATLPAEWAGPLQAILASEDEATLQAAVPALRALATGRRPALRRSDPRIDFAESSRAFAGTALVEKFAVRWTGFLTVARAGRYRFSLASNDGARLYLDGRMVVDNGGSHALQERRGEVELAAGPHALRLDFFQNGGTHACVLAWEVDGRTEPVPAEALSHSGSAGPEPGLWGEYYDLGQEMEEFPELSSFDFREPLLALARQPGRPEAIRVQALAAISTPLEQVDPAVFELLLRQLDPAQPPESRLAATGVLGRARLEAAQLDRLAAAIKQVGALELPKLLGAFAAATDEALGRKLVASLLEARGVGSLRVDQLKGYFARFPAPVQQDLQPLLDRLQAELAEQTTRLDQLLTQVNGGDRDRGRRLFESPKTACITCHQVGYVGGKVGPDLTRVGGIRTERDLLEALVYPSASFVRSYEPYLVTTRDGEDYSGVLREESLDTLLMITGANSEVRLRRADVKDIQPGAVSTMPQGLDEQFSPSDLADLIAFLKSLR